MTNSMRCTHCKQTKLWDDFYWANKSKNQKQNNCKPCLKAIQAKSHAKNPERRKEIEKRYKDKNKAKINEARRLKWITEKEHKKTVLKLWIQKNPGKTAIYSKNYRNRNPEKSREKAQVSNRKRRALRKHLNWMPYSTSDVLEKYGDTCYLCENKIDMTASRRVGQPGWEQGLHIDHLLDIALGGDDSLENVRPTHGKCNLTKKAILKSKSYLKQ